MLFLQGRGNDHQNSWLCFCSCLNGPIKVIFQFCFWNFWRMENLFLTILTSKSSPFGKKNWKFPKTNLLSKNYILFEFVLYMFTPHLKWKKLSNNSSWDFEYVLDIVDNYWVGPDKDFCPESTPTRWRCNHFFKKWPKWKLDTTFTIKKLLLPLLSVSEIFLGCIVLEI